MVKHQWKYTFGISYKAHTLYNNIDKKSRMLTIAACFHLLQKHPHQSVLLSIIGLIAQRQINPPILFQNILLMGKGFKAPPAVIGTHTAVSYAAEAHPGSGQMHHSIVDTASAEAAA